MKRHLFLASLGIAAGLFSLLSASSRVVAAPDNTQGMALLGGYIEMDGTIRNGVSSGLTDVQHPNAGYYVLTFDRNIVACSYAAVTFSSTAVVRLVLWGGSQLGFQTALSTNNAAVDSAFSFIVFCPQ